MTHFFITLLLGPLLLIQGKLVRRNMIDLPEPEGARKGIKGKGKPLRIMIIGDSAAAGVGVDHQNMALLGQLVERLSDDFCVSWQLEAITGATTQSTIDSLEKIQDKIFDVIITSLGVNDVTANVNLTKFLKLQNNLQNKCLKKFKPQLVIITALPPVHEFPALPQPLRWYLGRRAKQFNQALEKQIFTKNKLHFLSIGNMDDINVMAADGFHPGEQVYQQWALKAADKINSEFFK